MPILESVMKGGPLHVVDAYVKRQGKAALVDAVNCRPESFLEECFATKNYYGKTKGMEYYHVVMSFKPGEVSPEEAMEMAKEFVARNPMLRGHEVLFATHVDKPHIHTHIVINSVNAVTGDKLHMNKKDYRDVWLALNREISREHGFPPVEMKRKRGDLRVDNKRKYEVISRADRDADILAVYRALHEARKHATNWEEFEKLLQGYNVQVERSPTRKHVVYGFNGRRFRDSNIGRTFTENFSKEELENEFRSRQKKRDIECGIERRKRESECRKYGPDGIDNISVLPVVCRTEGTRERTRTRERD